MKGSELKIIIKEHGCSFLKSGANHDIWINADGKKMPIPRHDSKEVPGGTCNKILKWAGVK